MIIIKILGGGCANCKRLEQIARQVCDEVPVQAEIIKVTDPVEIMKYPILSTPGLVVNEKVLSAGRIPSKGEVTDWLKDYA
jgi:small redox-active disulfide protein 2